MALKTLTVNVRTADMDTFVDACNEAGWLLEDTGDRIMTDDGPEAEAVIRVSVPCRTPKGGKQAVLTFVPC